jgi:hypothetical protein
MTQPSAGGPIPSIASSKRPIPIEQLHIELFTGEKSRILQAMSEIDGFRDPPSFREQFPIGNEHEGSGYEPKGKQ